MPAVFVARHASVYGFGNFNRKKTKDFQKTQRYN
jgi:hypothetical protein